MTVGVSVTTSTIPGPGSLTTSPGATYFVAGQTLRGNSGTVVQVTSMTQFALLFGTRVTYGNLWDDLSMYFGEGGTQAWVSRVVGPAAAAGVYTLNDASSVATLRLTAGAPSVDPIAGTNLGNVADPGAWSAGVTVQPVASPLAGYYKILVFFNGVQVEQWGPFPDVPTCVTAINNSSGYLLATNMASTSGSPNPVPLSSPVALTAGTDDRTHITAALYEAELPNFPPALGPGYVAIPGQDASIVGTSLIAHALANGRIAHLSPTEGMSPTTVETAAAAFRGTVGSQCAGYFWPWVTIPDGNGGSRIVPPDGFVAGVRANTIVGSGPWQAPAGAYGVAQYVTGLDPASGVVTDAVGDLLNTEQVNVIRPKAGVRLYGWRSLSTDTVNFGLLTQQDTLNLIAYELEVQLQQYVFATIDALGQLFSQMTTTATNVLTPLIEANALYPGPAGSNGGTSDPGYVIDTGSDVNTPQTLAANEAAIAVYVRLSPSAELIPATVVKVAVGVAF